MEIRKEKTPFLKYEKRYTVKHKRCKLMIRSMHGYVSTQTKSNVKYG